MKKPFILLLSLVSLVYSCQPIGLQNSAIHGLASTIQLQSGVTEVHLSDYFLSASWDSLRWPARDHSRDDRLIPLFCSAANPRSSFQVWLCTSDPSATIFRSVPHPPKQFNGPSREWNKRARYTSLEASMPGTEKRFSWKDRRRA